MLLTLKKIKPIFFFKCFTLTYIISFILPTYFIHPLVASVCKEYITNYLEVEENQILYGYQTIVIVFDHFFRSPIMIIGSLSNLAVFTMFIFQLLHLPGKLVFLKNILVVTCIVSTLIWPVALRIGMMSGYYCWMISCIGMSISFSIQKPYQKEHEDQVLDDLQL